MTDLHTDRSWLNSAGSSVPVWSGCGDTHITGSYAETSLDISNVSGPRKSVEDYPRCNNVGVNLKLIEDPVSMTDAN
jgi:hypothetical protein